MKMCEFLRSYADIASCSTVLDQLKLPHHGIRCKDWDMAHIVPDLGMGNLIDMGSSDSWLLAGATMRGIPGLKLGIDLRPPDQLVRGCAFMIGDLMKTGLPAHFFESITCLSVIEHNVDFNAFAAEVDRLLQPGGKLYLTFDYWEPKIVQTIKLYNMSWNILCRQEVEQLVGLLQGRGLSLVEEIDWTLGEPVVSGQNWGPPGCIPYTFGLLTFKK
jgi:SAM-dependent methyltransferase